MIWFNCTHLQNQQAAISSQHALIHTKGVCFTTHLETKGKLADRVSNSVIAISDWTACSNYTLFASRKVFGLHVSLRNTALVNYRNMNVFYM